REHQARRARDGSGDQPIDRRGARRVYPGRRQPRSGAHLTCGAPLRTGCRVAQRIHASLSRSARLYTTNNALARPERSAIVMQSVAQVDCPQARHESEDRPTPAASTTPLVYVIDDDASLLRALRRLLAAGGFRVCTFSSAEEFLESAAATPACPVPAGHLGGRRGADAHERAVPAR